MYADTKLHLHADGSLYRCYHVVFHVGKRVREDFNRWFGFSIRGSYTLSFFNCLKQYRNQCTQLLTTTSKNVGQNLAHNAETKPNQT